MTEKIHHLTSSHQGLGVQKPQQSVSFSVFLTVTLGLPLCALDSEGGCSSIILVFRLMFGLAGCFVCTKSDT